MTEATPAADKSPAAPTSLIIRPWPKVVFLYPTFVVATIFWLISRFSSGGAEADVGMIGNLFMIVFAFNLLVFAFDFSRIKSITIAIALLALILGIGWANTQWEWVAGIREALASIDIRMNTQFYGFISSFFAFILLLVFVNARFNYYEINHRELLHHHGYLGDVTRIPTTGLHVHKEIHDLVEFMLLRSGRLVFYPQGKREALVIDNVMNVNKVEDHIKDLLSVMAVRVSDDMAQHEH